MKKISIIALASLSIASCKPDLGGNLPTAGDADFSNYVALGNSLTAGYADGTLYRTGQQNSYPMILSDQFRLVGGGDFKQPLLPGEAGWPSLKRVLGYYTDCLGETSLFPVTYKGTLDTAGSSVNVSSQGPYNNLGVPGIRAVDYLVNGYALFNPYAKRLYSNTANTPLAEAQKTNPTFFSIWLGSNDVLGYALAGGTGQVNGISPSDISDPNTFRTAYNSVVSTMTAKGAKGVLINIPDITTIPFFTTVPPDGLELDSAKAKQLNDAFAGTGETYHVGKNYFMVQDKSLLGGRRRIKEGELILLSVPLDSIKCYLWGTVTPIPDRYFLDITEVNNIKTATTAFNNIIKENADAKGLAYVDMNAYLKVVNAGINFNGVDYTTQFATGGTFSLDGIHLTPRGYALAANLILKAINAKYNSTIPQVDVNKYGGIKLP